MRWIFEAPEKGESGILVICIDKEIDEVLHTLAHEFSHLMQWYEDDPFISHGTSVRVRSTTMS